MKKIVALVFVIAIAFSLTACKPVIRDSLEEYIETVERNEYKVGSSSRGLDHPKYLLPSDSFFFDYTYSNGGYYRYENGLVVGDENCKSILWLEYTPEVYTEAKASLNDIITQSKRSYSYGDYSFFLHHDFNEDDGGPYPEWFTLAGYNDTTYTLFFLGFYLYPSRFNMSSEELNALMEPDFGKFLNTFYSEQYNFEENRPVD